MGLPGEVALSHVALAAATRVAGGVSKQRSDSGRRVPGEPGIWVFIFGDMMLFVVYFGVFLANRSGHADLFRRSQSALHQGLGTLNTLVLLTSSLLVILGVRARSGDRGGLASRYILGAAGCGLVFVGIKIVEYTLLAHDHKVGGNVFFLYYFTLTGIHLAHVVLGIVVLIALSRIVRRPRITTGRRVFVEGAACWWHMVDLIWVILFPLLYLAR